jgi:hypothetical protein
LEEKIGLLAIHNLDKKDAEEKIEDSFLKINI